MKPRAHSPILLAMMTAVLLLGALRAGAAVFVVPTDTEMIRSADAIVLGMAGEQTSAFARNRDIVTFTTIHIERVYKGAITTDTIAVRDLGGVVGEAAMGVSGGVTYQPGERVLLFLAADPSGSWTTWGLSLGKMCSMRDLAGGLVLTRNMGSDVIGLDEDGLSDFVEIPREEDAFLSYVRHVVAEGRRENREPKQRDLDSPQPQQEEQPPLSLLAPGEQPDYYSKLATAGKLTPVIDARFVPGVENHQPPNAYTQGTFRWNVFDAGGSVTYYYSNTQPPLDAPGAAQRAVNAWTNEPNSNVRLVLAGQRTAGFVQDGFNTIVFNNSTDVPAGAIGYAKWYGGAQHTYKGVSFYSISEGDVVMKAGISISQAAFDEAVTHEVGHTLGFRHSDQGTPASNDAVMRSVVSGRYGASLGPWDIEAVTHVYGTGTTPPPCTAPAITAQPTSRTITRGSNTTLSVSATGTAPLSYQWYIGSSGTTSSPISGATGASITVAPTSTTSYWVRVTNSCGTANSTTATVTVNTTPPPTGGSTFTRGDLNFDGRSDILWRNSSTGENRVWMMNGTSVGSTVALPSETDQSWRLIGAGEFNGDQKQDLVWRNMSTGANRVWLMNGTTRNSTVALDSVPDTTWDMVSVYHYDQNGTSDLLFRNRSNGTNALWFMTGTTRTSTTSIATVTTDWQILGTGDFNTDQWEDILWRNTNTNQIVIWFMLATNMRTTTALPTVPSSWTFGAIGDFDRNGFPDVVWRDSSNGTNTMWLTAGGQVIQTVTLPTDGNLAWRIVGPR